MKFVVGPEDSILCMSNVTGKYVKNPHKLKFSFYYSTKEGVPHGIRVKPTFNPERMSKSRAGNLELHGDWKYTPSPDDVHVSKKDIEDMKNFFRDNKVLFAAVWEEEIPEDVLGDYFKGHVDFDSLLHELYNYDQWESHLKQVHDVSTLEQLVRSKNLWNMND